MKVLAVVLAAAFVLFTVSPAVAMSATDRLKFAIEQHSAGEAPQSPALMKHHAFVQGLVSDADAHAAQVDSEKMSSFVELQSQVRAEVGVVHSYCEICILIMQMKQRGQPHLCAGLSANYYVTCVENLISILRADKAVVYWLDNGCMHMDASGPEIVRPCPPINICSFIPNLFAPPPSPVKNSMESLCPKDKYFLPTIPSEFQKLLEAGAEEGVGEGAEGGEE